MTEVTPRQQKLAAAYDADIWPLLPERGAAAILRALPPLTRARILEVGSRTGRLTMQVAARADDTSQIRAIEPSATLVAVAEEARRKSPAGGKVIFEEAAVSPTLPVDNDSFDMVLSNLAVGEAPDMEAMVAELMRALKPGGRLLFTLPLRGSWGSFLDLYGDVLTEHGRLEGREALRRYQASLPTSDMAARWVESAGGEGVKVEVDRWELLFKTAREFFFAPIVELGPLATWKQIAGGRGDEMQDVFFFVKEAIETYFARQVFPVEMVIGSLQATKRRKEGPRRG